MTNEEFQKAVLEKLSSLEQGQNSIIKKLDTVHDQTVSLTDFRIETNIKFEKVLNELQGIRKDLSIVEVVTANNYADIAKLKAVK